MCLCVFFSIYFRRLHKTEYKKKKKKKEEKERKRQRNGVASDADKVESTTDFHGVSEMRKERREEKRREEARQAER